MSITDRNRVRTLTDDTRKNPRGSGAIITAGIAALGIEVVERLVKTITVFDDFCNANDPHGKHDGTFDFDGTIVMFRIDYYDKSLNSLSLNPADPSVTERVITIMRADEY
jgi:hypothetical protein